jgi:hypothetical protein
MEGNEMIGVNVSDEVIDAIAFIEMHRQEAAKESGAGVACAQALPKLQALLEEIDVNAEDPADVRAANIAAVNNDIARVKRFAGGGQGGRGNHQRAGGGGQKKQPPRQYSEGHAQGRALNQGRGLNQARSPDQGQGPIQVRRDGADVTSAVAAAEPRARVAAETVDRRDCLR